MSLVADLLLFVTDPAGMAMLIGATIAGVLIGAMPGLTSTIAIGLLIPVTFTMSQNSAMIMLVSVFCGAMYGGSIPGIILNLPGTPTAAISAIDGFPMTRKGGGGKALGISTISSAIGGLISAFFLIVLSQQLSNVAILFAGPEYFAVCVFAFVIVIVLASKDILKGLISVGLGLLLSTVGIDSVTPVQRYTFGIEELLIGIPIVPATIGMFCLSEAFRMVGEPGAIAKSQSDLSGVAAGFAEVRKLKWTVLRSSLIGVAIGCLPGSGSVTASYLSYAEARRTADDPSEFGNGAPAGVASAESANNAVTGGALIPMLTLGIPGDPNTLMILGALFIHGLVPGPSLFTEQTSLVNVIYITVIGANLVILPFGLLMARWISRVALIDKNYLLPVVLVLAIAGPSISYGHIYYFWITIAFGIFGYLLIRGGYSVLGCSLALILGPPFEQNLRSAAMLPDFGIQTFLGRPIVLGILVMSLLVIALSIVKRRAAKRVPEVLAENSDERT